MDPDPYQIIRTRNTGYWFRTLLTCCIFASYMRGPWKQSILSPACHLSSGPPITTTLSSTEVSGIGPPTGATASSSLTKTSPALALIWSVELELEVGFELEAASPAASSRLTATPWASGLHSRGGSLLGVSRLSASSRLWPTIVVFFRAVSPPPGSRFSFLARLLKIK